MGGRDVRVDPGGVAPDPSGGQPPPAQLGYVRNARGRWASSLEATLSSTIVPYGYTVTVWICGAYLVRKHGAGAPGVGLGEGTAFAAGALFAFGALAALSGTLSLSRSSQPAAPGGPELRHPIFAAGLHVLAVGLAAGISMLASSSLGSSAWFVSPFLATSIYLAVASAELAFALELSCRDSRFAHGVRVRRPAHDTASTRESAEARDRV